MDSRALGQYPWHLERVVVLLDEPIPEPFLAFVGNRIMYCVDYLDSHSVQLCDEWDQPNRCTCYMNKMRIVSSRYHVRHPPIVKWVVFLCEFSYPSAV